MQTAITTASTWAPAFAGDLSTSIIDNRGNVFDGSAVTDPLPMPSRMGVLAAIEHTTSG